MNSFPIALIFRVNIILFILLLPVLFGLVSGDGSRFFRFSESAILLAVIFVLPAINTTTILSKLSKISFDKAEFISIAAVTSVLLVPFLVSIEADALHILFPHLPIINAAISFLLLSILSHPSWNTQEKNLVLLEERHPHPTGKRFVAMSIVIVSAILAVITAYYPLPDLDPYYWISAFQDQFTKGVISSISSYRPLFSSLAYIFNQSAGIDLYAFLKYLLPFIALLPLIPASLIARRFTRQTEQACIYLLPIANASFFLYSTMPIPQAIFNSLFVAAILFSIHSLLSGKKLFFYTAGIILFFAFFYHEMAAIPLFAWLSSLLFFERRTILYSAKKNRIITGLIILLALSYFPLMSMIFSFIIDWGSRLLTLLSPITTNLAFPAEYVNIDGNSVGWKDAAGVIRYYAFYFGPAALLILITFPFILRNPTGRLLLKREESWFLLLSAGVFLLISDILPRLFNIALLPERALSIASVILISFIPVLFLVLHTKKNALFRFIPVLIFLALLINLSAALYINNLKKYLITPSQLTSAEWIKTQLPANKVIFSIENQRLLEFYAGSAVAEVRDPSFYTDEQVFQRYFDIYKTSDPDHRIGTIRSQLSRVSSSLSSLSNKQVSSSSAFLPGIRTNIADLDAALRLIQESENIQNGPAPEFYIYYASPSEKNPYIDRPYMPKRTDKEIHFFFDRHPERFRAVYSDEKNQIYIWKIL